MNISVIIPNLNGENLLKKNLPKVLNAVKGYDKGKIEIIIPDDPSTDNSQQVIKDFIDGIQHSNITGKTVRNSNKNLAGFSRNVNRGVSLASGDIIILFNTDVTPSVNFLVPLLSHFKDEGVFAVGCMDESEEGGRKVLRGRGLGNFERGFLIHRRGEVDRTNTLWVNGGSGAFRKSIWDKLGGLDTLYDPFYWEDIDISYRALKSGYKIFFEPKSIVNHDHEHGSVQSEFNSSYVKKIAYRNQFIFVWKNITDKKLLFSHLLWLPYHIIKSLLTADWAFLNGLLMAISSFDAIRKSRVNVKKLFIKDDEAVIKDNK